MNEKDMLKQMLGGGDGKEVVRALIADFTFCAVIGILKDHLKNEADPQATVVTLIEAWQQRVLKSNEQQLEAVAAFQESTMGAIMSPLIPPKEDVEREIHAALREVTEIIERGLLG